MGALKRYLAKKHFHYKYVIRLLHEEQMELKENDNITPPLDLQLVLVDYLPPDRKRDVAFLESCEDGDFSEVERNLRALQNPNFCFSEDSPLTLAADSGHSEVVRRNRTSRA